MNGEFHHRQLLFHKVYDKQKTDDDENVSDSPFSS